MWGPRVNDGFGMEYNHKLQGKKQRRTFVGLHIREEVQGFYTNGAYRGL